MLVASGRINSGLQQYPLFIQICFERFIAAFVTHLGAISNPVTQVDIIEVTATSFIDLTQYREVSGAAICKVGIEKGI